MGMFISFCIVIISMLNIGLYAGSRSGSDGDCGSTTYSFKIRDRTVGLGETVSGLSMFLGLFALAFLAVRLFTSHSPAKHYGLIGMVLFLSIFMFSFWVVPWSLLSKDMADFDHFYGGVCDMPYTWSTALFFSLFDMLLWFLMCINSLLSLILDREGN